MATITYTGVDGKEYTFELNDIDLSTINPNVNINSNDIINWYNLNFDIPISYGNLGFDPNYTLTINSLTYLGNAMKSSNEEDYKRWTTLFKQEISKTLVQEANILRIMLERYQKDYGEPSVDIANKIQSLLKVTQETNKLISGFASMASVSSFLTSFAAVIVPLAIITGTIVVIQSIQLKAEQPKRQQQIIAQSEKVQKMIESFSQPQLIDTLRTFDKPAPQPENNDNTPLYIAGAVFVYMVIIVILKRIKDT